MSRTGSSNATGLRDYTKRMKAGIPAEIVVAGDYFMVQLASSPITAHFNSGAEVRRGAGEGVPVLYENVMLTSDVDQTVVVSLGYTLGATPVNSRPIQTGDIIVEAKIASVVNDLDDKVCPPGVPTMIAAASANRTELNIQIPFDAGDGIRIGSASVDSTRGLKAYAGDIVVYANRGPIYLFNGSTAAITVSLQENLAP